jgi:hypothetical protein
MLIFVIGNIVFSLFNPEDVFWGELGGCMEAIDGGTTTVVDHAHINYSADHCKLRRLKPFGDSFADLVISLFCAISNRGVWNSLVLLLLSSTPGPSRVVGPLPV